MRERIAEDRRSLALAGRTPVNLDFLDDQYREIEQPVTAEIALFLVRGAHIYAPGAFASHPDHLLVRAAALELRTEGFPVTLYADLPHATVYGWPTWVRRTDSHAAKDLATGFWDRSLAATGISPQAMTPIVHGLEADAYAHKLAAMRAYGTQVQALAGVVGRSPSDPETFGYEVVWTLPSGAKHARQSGMRLPGERRDPHADRRPRPLERERREPVRARPVLPGTATLENLGGSLRGQRITGRRLIAAASARRSGTTHLSNSATSVQTSSSSASRTSSRPAIRYRSLSSSTSGQNRGASEDRA